jgi:predicted HicB family RNase H-like nuclease
VSYTSLDSQTMAAANAAADAAGISLEEWLSRTILENARRSGIIPGQASIAGEESDGPPAGAFTRHLRSAQVAADAAGISVAEWLSRTILDNTRRSMVDPAPPLQADRLLTKGTLTKEPPTAAPAPALEEPAEPEPPAQQAGPVGQEELVEERFAQVVAGWRQELDAAELSAAEAAKKTAADRRAVLMLTDHVPNGRKERGTVPWLAASAVIVLAMVAAVIWVLPHLPPPHSTEEGPTSRIADDGAGAPPRTVTPAKPRKPAQADLAKVLPADFPRPAAQHAAWYIKAANAGNAEAQHDLATLYLRGAGVPKSLEDAATWFSRAAREGKLAKAQYALGVLYARGKGVAQNDVEAVLLYRRAADQGYVPAITEVGLAFLHGKGVKQDLARARRFLERAAEAGEVNAQYTLGRIHERGIGVPKDKVRALKWFILAAEQKHRLAAQRVEDMSIGMKRDQQDRAAELAREHHRRFPAKKKAGN